MYDRSVAVIPARGGSTRLVNKNTTLLGGKPLISWITEAVIDSACFDKVIISTDSDDIFDCVSHYAVERHVRPKDHATTKATVLNAMINLMENHEPYEIFSYFLPTCPFITPRQITTGYNMLEKYWNKCDSVVSMTKMQDTVQLACLMQDDHVLPVFDNLESGLTNSKFIKQYYKPSGAFYMGYWSSIMRDKNFFKGNTRGVIIPTENSIDINTKTDMELAEALLNANSI
jgi:N-acylneuraminate cytidylyltransferase